MKSYEEQLKDIEKDSDRYSMANSDLRTQHPYSMRRYDTNPFKKRIFVHMNSYYLPDSIRGMTDTVKHIWINSKEYFKKFVLRHKMIHFAHPEWSEETVREFHGSYEPHLPNVELEYV